ncbi:hypothetical protein [Nocardioides iriomotensis]|jgi:hypothetical protein|uniref:Uncharacterized protein n=1 Tax=Nocardioides iriomotensis TaxID=715784 RepID=A0A4Q5JCK4_9ACTN|nr:hypothetical protein [Nocardioides iriomotensis]RYU15645.1 hypothetical protein ETU37_00565 [Nocardioides iriomotensis]
MQLTARPAALVAGTLFAATAAIDVPHVQAQPFAGPLDYALEALFAAALWSAALALWLLSRAATGRGRRVAWRVPAAGCGLVAVAATATLVAAHDVLGPVFMLGLLLVLAGYLVLAVLDLRRRLTPRFAGLCLAAGTVGMVALGDGVGTVAWAAAWFGVAALLQPASARVSEPAAA